MKTKSALPLFVLLLACTTASHAQPGYYKVISSLTEHLNVRAESTAQSKDIGDIQPGAQPFELLEIDSTGEWGRIPWQETTGWVALQFMESIQLPLIADTIVPVGLLCAGTEPFWTIEFESEENAVLSTQEAVTPMSLSNITVSKNRNELPVAIETLSATNTTVTVLRRETCNDGLTDINYSWAADMIVQPELNLLSGCCVMR